MKRMIVDDHKDTRRVVKSVVLLGINDSVNFLECDNGQVAIATYRHRTSTNLCINESSVQ